MGWVRAHGPEAEKAVARERLGLQVPGSKSRVGMGSGAVQWGLVDGTGVGAGSKGK